MDVKRPLNHSELILNLCRLYLLIFDPGINLEAIMTMFTEKCKIIQVI